MSTIIAITSTFNSRKSYVTSYFNRFDKKVAVELTIDQAKAKDFRSLEEAKKILARIYNPYDREYVVEEIAIGATVFNKAKTESWLEARVLK